MAYKPQVQADNPAYYFYFDAMLGDFTNYGTAGGVGVQTGMINRLQEPAKFIPGYSMSTAASTAGRIDAANGTGMNFNANAFTIEFWYKAISNTNATRTIMAFNVGAGTQLAVTLNTANGYLRMADSGGVNDGITNTTLIDRDWHHVVITKQDALISYYYDKVLVGSFNGTVTAKTNPTFRIGTSVGSASLNGFLDEVAIYPYVLSESRIQNHYNEATMNPSVPVKVTAPPMIQSLATVAPIRTRLGNKQTSTPMTQTLTYPSDVGVSAVDNYTKQYYPTMMRSLTAAGQGTNVLAFGYNATNDWRAMLIKFPDIEVPNQGTYVQQSLLRLVGSPGSTTAAQPYKIWIVNGTWTDGSYTNNTYTLQDSGISGTLTQGTNMIDITSIARDWYSGAKPNNGIYVERTVGNMTNGYIFVPDENAGASSRPQMTTYIDDVPAVPVKITSPSMSLSVSEPAPKINTGVKVLAPSSSMLLTLPEAYVAGGTSVRVNSQAIELSAYFIGGKPVNPDYLARANSIEMDLFIQNVTARSGQDAKIASPAMALSLSATSAQFNGVTNRSTKATAMRLDLEVVGIYDAADDRYLNYVSTTVDADDVWYRMDELSGSIANDSAVNTTGGGARVNAQDGTYVGTPTFDVSGPQQRPAIAFDGIDDYLALNHGYFPDGSTSAGNNIFADMDLTVEFSIKTTARNGIIYAGTGARPGNLGGAVTGTEVRLVNGEMVLVINGSSTTFRVRQDIADGKWHHVVISLANSFMTNERPSFVNIDGESVFVRYGFYTQGNNLGFLFLPYSVLARPDGSVKTSGAMRDLIIRTNYAVSQKTASKLYYEWSNATLVSATPMELNLSGDAAPVASGNVKKMLVVYGLGTAFRTNSDIIDAYRSIFAGYNLPLTGAVDFNNYVAAQGWQPVKPFYMHGYLCYPVHILGGPGKSADGVLNREYQTTPDFPFIDDRTGRVRFLDLELDLTSEVTDYDAITVMNYPNTRPLQTGSSFDQRNEGMTNEQWTVARDGFKATLMSANRAGVKLWINEPHMANHLGFIGAWDEHSTGRWVESNTSTPVNPNYAARELDNANRTSGTGATTPGLPNTGDYASSWQSNMFRRIVSTEPNLTDIPSFEITAGIGYYTYDPLRSYNRVWAYKVEDKTAGLVPGDMTKMSMFIYGGPGDVFGNPSTHPVGKDRKVVVSARPEGVVGKIIAREQQTYFGPRRAGNTNETVQNPFRNNAVTIAVEKGTVVEGQTTGAR